AVVDVYQGWCGPCKPVVSLFQKMRIEVGLDLLHFASAEADRLDVLEKYRGKCEPTFLFYAIKDEALSDEDGCFSHGKDIGEDEDLVSSEKACTVAIIKPDAVAHGKTDEIIMKVRETLTLHDCPHVLCGGQQGGTLVPHSKPDHLCTFTRYKLPEQNISFQMKQSFLLHFASVPSLHAQYGTEMPFNAVHESRDREAAHRELALLFPNSKFSDKDIEALTVSEASVRPRLKITDLE
uniref:NME/NM23 family member 9 n=1 Tax=Propithecus coquereli TaxID=379532 RepID=A0A2K6FFQ2_PROCO